MLRAALRASGGVAALCAAGGGASTLCRCAVPERQSNATFEHLVAKHKAETTACGFAVHDIGPAEVSPAAHKEGRDDDQFVWVTLRQNARMLDRVALWWWRGTTAASPPSS